MSKVPTSALTTGDTVLHDGVEKFVADAMQRWPKATEGGGLGRKKMWDVIFRDAPNDAIPAPHDQEWDRVEPARV